jgi:ribosomal protein S13
MHILGIIIPDHLTTRVKLSILLSAKNLILLVQFALRRIYGVGDHIAHRLCARLQVHDRCKVKDLTPFQVTSLASFLSSPATALPLPRFPLAPLNYSPPPSSISTLELQTIFDEAQKKKKKKNVDPLRKLKIEYWASADDWQLCWEETRYESSCPGTEHAKQRADGEET